jgi:hypothetical protein
MKANCGQCAAHQGLIRRPTSGICLERARRRTADLVRLFLEFLARPGASLHHNTRFGLNVRWIGITFSSGTNLVMLYDESWRVQFRYVILQEISQVG